MRKLFVAGNWKMNLQRASAIALAKQTAGIAAANPSVSVGVGPTFVHLPAVADVLIGSPPLIAYNGKCPLCRAQAANRYIKSKSYRVAASSPDHRPIEIEWQNPGFAGINMKSLTDIVNGVKSTVSSTLKNGKRALLVPVMALGMYAGSADASPVNVTFAPDQTGTVSAPVVGLGGTSSDYLLTNRFGTSLLDKNFDGNNQERTTGWEEGNPTYAQDAASFDDNYMFQLGTDNGLRKIAIFDGAQTPFNGLNSINVGDNSFGIGYDATANSIGIGNFNPNTSMMSFSKYDLGTGELTPLVSFAFDTSKYGTPSGLDLVNMNGHLRMLIGTRDGFCMENEEMYNYVLDINATNGNLDQYFITGGNNTLQDLLYEDGRLILGYDRAGSGLVDVGNFTPVPEPATIIMLGLGAAGLLNYRAKNNTDHQRYEKTDISEIQLKADGVKSVSICPETNPGWTYRLIDPSEGFDINGNRSADRGIAIYSEKPENYLKPGNSMEFHVESAYSDNLQDNVALLFKQANNGIETKATGNDFYELVTQTPTSNQPFDFNGDGYVDGNDLLNLVDGWLSPREDLYGNELPEGLEPGIVNLKDFSKFAGNYRN